MGFLCRELGVFEQYSVFEQYTAAAGSAAALVMRVQNLDLTVSLRSSDESAQMLLLPSSCLAISARHGAASKLRKAAEVVAMLAIRFIVTTGKSLSTFDGPATRGYKKREARLDKRRATHHA